MTEIRAVRIIPEKEFIGTWSSSSDLDFGETTFQIFVELKQTLQAFIAEKLKGVPNLLGSPSVLYQSCKIENGKYNYFCGYEIKKVSREEKIEKEGEEEVEGEGSFEFPDHPDENIVKIKLPGGTFAVSSSMVGTIYSTPSQYTSREDLTYQGRFLSRSSDPFPVFEQTVNSGVVIFWRLSDEERLEMEMKKQILFEKRKKKKKEEDGDEEDGDEKKSGSEDEERRKILEDLDGEEETEENEDDDEDEEEEEDEYFSKYEHLIIPDESDPIILPNRSQFSIPGRKKGDPRGLRRNIKQAGKVKIRRRTRRKAREKKHKMRKRKRLPFIEDVEEEMPFRRGLDGEELERNRKRRKIQTSNSPVKNAMKAAAATEEERRRRRSRNRRRNKRRKFNEEPPKVGGGGGMGNNIQRLERKILEKDEMAMRRLRRREKMMLRKRRGGRRGGRGRRRRKREIGEKKIMMGRKRRRDHGWEVRGGGEEEDGKKMRNLFIEEEEESRKESSFDFSDEDEYERKLQYEIDLMNEYVKLECKKIGGLEMKMEVFREEESYLKLCLKKKYKINVKSKFL